VEEQLQSDPLAEFQKKLLASVGKVKYEVERVPTAADEQQAFTTLPEKPVAEIEKKFWTLVHGGALDLYACVKARTKKGELRVDFRVEAKEAVSAVTVAAGDASALLAEKVDVAGRGSGKLLLPCPLGAYTEPQEVMLSYTAGEQAVQKSVSVPVPVVAGFSRVELTDDQITQYCSQYAELVKETAGRTLPLPAGADMDAALADVASLGHFSARKAMDVRGGAAKYMLMSGIDLGERPIPLCLAKVQVSRPQDSTESTIQIAVRSGNTTISDKVAEFFAVALRAALGTP